MQSGILNFWAISFALCATIVGARGAEFPLDQAKFSAKDAMSASGFSLHCKLSLQKPASLNKEPKPASTRPLYGLWSASKEETMPFRLDESQGTG
jgi:hypothetical protein